jgi:hypothetical protein
MPRTNPSINDPFLPVTKVPLFTADGSRSSRYAVMLGAEGESEEVGIVSDSYNLVPNQIVHQVALDILTRSELPFEDDGMIFDGKKYRHRWIIPDLQLQPRPGDIVRLALDVINSYDGSSLFGLAFNAQRLVCTNGMVLDFLLGGFKFRHYGVDGFEEELEQASHQVHRLSDKLLPLTGKLSGLVDRSFSRVDVQEAFTALKLPQTLQAEIYMQIDEDNAWGFYNAATDVLTKQATHRSDSLNRQVSRYLLLN